MRLKLLALPALLAVALFITVGFSSSAGPKAAAAPIAGAPTSVVTTLSDLPGGATHFAVQPGTSAVYLPSINPNGNNRLYRFDLNSGARSDYSLPSNPGGGFFIGVQFGSDGGLWIAWDQTLARFDPASGQTVRYDIPVVSAYALPGKPGDWVRDMAIGIDGAIWLSRQQATSLLRFDPTAHTYSEFGLGQFGVPDAIRVDPSGKLWLTLARDPSTNEESTRVAIFDPSAGSANVVAEWASSVAFDTQGRGLLLGRNGVAHVDSKGSIASHTPLPQKVSVADLVTAAGGKIVVSNKPSSTVSIYDEATGRWTTHKLPTTMGLVVAPHGYGGPSQLEVTAQVTDIHVVGGTVLLLVPSSKTLLSLSL